MTKFKEIQKFVESLENSKEFDSAMVLNPADSENAVGGNGTCSGENRGVCTNEDSCVHALNYSTCTNLSYCNSTNSSCKNSETCSSFNDINCSNSTCSGTNNGKCTGGQSGGSNNGNSISFPGFGFM